MLISTKGRYALRVMIELAQYDCDKYVPLNTIAEKQEISEKYLESIFVLLSKSGLVDGLRGKGGGYKLNRKPSEYTAGEILRVTDGSLAPVACLEDCAKSKCAKEECCRTRPMWEKLDSIIGEYLDSVTIEDLLK